MNDFEEFEDENADEKINADIASADKQVRADAIERLAKKTWDKGNWAKAIVYLETVTDLRTEIEDYSGLSWAYMQLGFIRAHADQHQEAHTAFTQAAEAARKAMNVTSEIDALHNCGTSQRRLKNYSAAADYYMQAANLATENEYRFVAHIKADYARMLRKIGRTQEAEVLLAEATEHMLTHGFENNVPRVENELASALFEDSNAQLSLEKATEAYNLAKYDENEREADRAQFLMARCHNQLGNFAQAAQILEEMKLRAPAKKRQKHRARTDLELGRALIGLDRRVEAVSVLATVIPVLKAHKLKAEAADALRMHGHNLLIVAEALDAEIVLQEAVVLAEELDLDDIFIEATTLLAICYDALDRPAEKALQYEIIASNPLNMGRVEFWMAAGELAIHKVKIGDIETAERYIKAIKTGSSPFISPAITAQAEEAHAMLLEMDGQIAKAKNQYTKAIVNYLLEERTVEATRLANQLSKLR